MADKWWKTHCPICEKTGEPVMQVHEDTVLCCDDCEFQWSAKLPEHVVIVLARDHIRKGEKE